LYQYGIDVEKVKEVKKSKMYILSKDDEDDDDLFFNWFFFKNLTFP